MSPKVSVVVATRERSEYLVRCLGALRAQRFPVEDFEIVVVDDASRDPIVVDGGPAGGPPLRMIRREERGGPAGARNSGIAATTSPILAFTDDDCRPDPDWLAGGVREIERGLDLVAGRTLPDPDEDRARGPFDYSMHVPGPDARYSTCNMFYRRKTIERAGGFNSAFASASGYHLGEDSDLAWRAIEGGARAGYTAEALVLHAVRPQTFLEHLRSRRRLEGLVPLVKRYPGVKQAHFARHVYSATHLWTMLAVLGVALAACSPWALALVLPWIAWRSREKRALVAAPLRFLRRNRALPLFFVADVYEVWIFVVASIRHRHAYL